MTGSLGHHGRRLVGWWTQCQRKRESERDRDDQRRPEKAMDQAVRAPHRTPRELSQRAATYGHSRKAPGQKRMRAPRVSGIGCTCVTPKLTKASATIAPTARYAERRRSMAAPVESLGPMIDLPASLFPAYLASPLAESSSR